jgi:hypothetical protein
MLDHGRRGRTQIVPRAWIRDTIDPDDDTVAAFGASADARELPHGAYYRNKWWVVDPSAPIYMGSGINGQTVLIHGPAQVVVAKLSTWPVAWDLGYSVRTRTALVDLAKQVADGRL